MHPGPAYEIVSNTVGGRSDYIFKPWAHLVRSRCSNLGMWQRGTCRLSRKAQMALIGYAAYAASYVT